MTTTASHSSLQLIKSILSIYDADLSVNANTKSDDSSLHDFYERRFRGICRELTSHTDDHVYQELLLKNRQILESVNNLFKQSRYDSTPDSKNVLLTGQEDLLEFVELVEAREENLIERSHFLNPEVDDSLSE